MLAQVSDTIGLTLDVAKMKSAPKTHLGGETEPGKAGTEGKGERGVLVSVRINEAIEDFLFRERFSV